MRIVAFLSSCRGSSLAGERLKWREAKISIYGTLSFSLHLEIYSINQPPTDSYTLATTALLKP
jgi:hypothetical protein